MIRCKEMPHSRIYLPNHLMNPGPVFAVLLLLSGLSCCESRRGEFNHFWLVLQWPPAFQRQNPHDFTMQNPHDFTIHGLWPVDEGGRTRISICEDLDLGCSSWDLPLVQNLRQYWPSLTTQRSDENFWGYQWSKHGRTQSIFAPDEYFQKVIRLRQRAGDIIAALRAEGVMPGSRHSYRSFRRALSGIIGTDQVILTCGWYGLRELKICVNRNATGFIKCNSREMRLASCPEGFDFE